MSLPRTVLLSAIFLFCLVSLCKGGKNIAQSHKLAKEMRSSRKMYAEQVEKAHETARWTAPVLVKGTFPKANRVQEFFAMGSKKLPVVKTIVYSTSVPWLKGRPAWISDYAKEFATSRHFIARSLNRGENYSTPSTCEGNRFNVFSKDRPLQFHLVADLDSQRMGLYYFDESTSDRVFLKSYPIGVGYQLEDGPSVTPLGVYEIGENAAVYKKGMMEYHLDEKTEMIQIHGTRWLPFKSTPAIGIEGAPWLLDSKKGEFTEDTSVIGERKSNGSIQMNQRDVEELFCLVTTKPSFVQVVQQINQASLPGREVVTPTR